MAVEYLSGWPLSSWISPGAAFFLFVNVLIGAIVVTSRVHHHQGGRAGAAASTRRLCRSASSMVLDRLRSFSMFSGHPAVPVEEEYYSYSTSTSSAELELEAEELDQQLPQPAIAEPARWSPVAAAVVAAGPADGVASSEIAKEPAEAGQDMSTGSDDEAAHHGRLALQGNGQPPPSVDVVVTADEATAAVESQGQSQEEESAETTMPQRAPACRRETTEEALEGKAALNARADSFIRRFREDLKLERLNSIINYTRTLRRGRSAGAPSPTAQ